MGMLIVGMLIGAAAGILLASLCVMSKDGEHD
jgi:hypothetical protein